MSFLRTALICVAATSLVVAPSRPRAAGQAGNAAAVMARVGAYVERYYATAQRVVAVEAVTLQPLRSDLSGLDFPRRLEYDLRIEWTPGEDGRPGDAQVRRTLLKVNGRAPRPKDKPGCSDPRGVSPEPLAMFLPDQQGDYAFTLAKLGKAAGRRAMQVDYRPLKAGPISVSWHDDCVSIDVPGRSVGRLWADEATGEVLRVDEHLVGRYDIPVPQEHQRKGAAALMTLERSSSSIRYLPVRFHDPEETVLMPAEVETVQEIRDAGTPHLRIRQVFSNYRRFVTEGRILSE